VLAKLMMHVPFRWRPAVAAVLSKVELLYDRRARPFVGGKDEGAGVSAQRTGRCRACHRKRGGFPGFEERSWVGFFAPARTPGAIVSALNREINLVLALPDVKESFSARGMDLHPGSPADFAKHVRAEVAMWAKIKRAKRRVQAK
jgi:hypothetical protein